MAAAKIPKLEAHHRAPANAIRAHVDVPVKFLGTAVVVTKDTEEIETSGRLVPGGRPRHVAIHGCVPPSRRQTRRDPNPHVRFTLVSRKTVLAMQALQGLLH